MNDLALYYIELQPRLYRFFYAKTFNRAVSEDLTQDVFYEATRSLQRYTGQASISTWLFAIAQNLLKKYYRSHQYERQLTTKLEQTTTEMPFTTEQLVELQEQTKLLLAKIHELDDLSKDLVLLRIYGELSFKEIGELLGKSENYARVTFHRLKLKLKQEMEGFE